MSDKENGPKESGPKESNWLTRLMDSLGLQPKHAGVMKMVAVGLALGVILLNASDLFGVGDGGGRQPSGATMVDGPAPTAPDELSRLEQQLARELEVHLAAISGAGKVTASVKLAAGPTVVPVTNTQITSTTTTEKMGEGQGERVSNQQGQETTHVMVSEGGNQSLAVTKQLREQIAGVLITAEGASNSKVRYMIHEAVVTYLNIPAHQVQVLPAGGR